MLPYSNRIGVNKARVTIVRKPNIICSVRNEYHTASIRTNRDASALKGAICDSAGGSVCLSNTTRNTDEARRVTSTSIVFRKQNFPLDPQSWTRNSRVEQNDRGIARISIRFHARIQTLFRCREPKLFAARVLYGRESVECVITAMLYIHTL